MGMHGMKRIGVFCVCTAMVPTLVWASFGPAGGDHREPPQAAFDVCKGKSEGTSVEIVTPHGTKIKATCKKFKDTLAAVPEGAPPALPKGEDRGQQGNSNR